MGKLRSYDIGFVGAGNMATALARGVIRAGLAEPGRVCASDVSPERRAAFVKATGAVGLENNGETVEGSEMAIIAVKPQMADEVLKEVGKRFVRSQIVVSIAAGVTSGHIELHCAEPVGVVRVMPNTPALVGEGMSAIAGESMRRRNSWNGCARCSRRWGRWWRWRKDSWRR